MRKDSEVEEGNLRGGHWRERTNRKGINYGRRRIKAPLTSTCKIIKHAKTYNHTAVTREVVLRSEPAVVANMQKEGC
ncbi:hypothetical protein KP509_11G069900 [Ceratopteris richardii]|uniref:Uncharacterized protein n=1 Tax=Ceratopteris richardii TaxID=49495 RepID=A0A8T2TTN3_CERRI|nr:hypothetical protein KP509_11G069900 [Ceratopteris richardii]